MYAGSLSGVYKAAYESGIPVRFVHQDHIGELLESGIRCLYLPMALVLSGRETEVFEEFVRRGGTLVSEACPGLYKTDGLLDQKSAALRRLFDVNHREIQGIRDFGPVNAVWEEDDSTITGSFYRQLITPGESARVAARFEDGEPAVAVRDLGTGRAVWIGTYPSCQYERDGGGDPGTRAFLTRFMEPGGYELIERIQISEAERGIVSRAPVVRLLETESGWAVMAVNHLPRPAWVDIHFKARDLEDIHLELKPEDGACRRMDRRREGL